MRLVLLFLAVLLIIPDVFGEEKNIGNIDSVKINSVQETESKYTFSDEDVLSGKVIKLKKGTTIPLTLQTQIDTSNAQVNDEIAATLDLQNLLDRYPNELSGGQQQRVALARAFVLNPELLLMDEPLSSLDAKLREKLREELRAIQQELKITTIYVTHDQEEALSLSDRIAVMNGGKILQYGVPRDLYFKPQDNFTADFAGRANFLELDGEPYIIRPEWFDLNKTTAPGDVEGRVKSASFLGDMTRFVIEATSVKGKAVQTTITADLKTLDSNSLEAGSLVSLNINHKLLNK